MDEIKFDDINYVIKGQDYFSEEVKLEIYQSIGQITFEFGDGSSLWFDVKTTEELISLLQKLVKDIKRPSET